MLLSFPKNPRHARTSSTGYKSGRSSERGTPVADSMGKTNSADTPRLERISQYQTCDCVVPIRSAKCFWPPAISQARSRAEDMPRTYQEISGSQPNTLLGTAYREFGSIADMFKTLGERVLHRRTRLELSQPDLARLSGMSQQNIASIEASQDTDRRPRRLPELAEALGTTPDWLLYERGPEINPILNPEKQIFQELQNLTPDEMLVWARRIAARKKVAKKKVA